MGTKRVTVTAEGAGQTIRFNSEVDTSDDIHGLDPGDYTPGSFDRGVENLRDDLNDLFKACELDGELGFDASAFRVTDISKGATRGLQVIEV